MDHNSAVLGIMKGSIVYKTYRFYCFDRSVYSVCAICNDMWLKFARVDKWHALVWSSGLAKKNKIMSMFVLFSRLFSIL